MPGGLSSKETPDREFGCGSGLVSAITSPWGACCGVTDLPGQEWILAFLDIDGETLAGWQFRAFGDDVQYAIVDEEGTTYPTSYADAWSGSLSAGERERVHAAMEMLGCETSRDLLASLRGALSPFGLLALPLEAARNRLAAATGSGVRGTIIGKNSRENPFYRLMFDSTVQGSTKVTLKGQLLGGVTAPGSFVFPLQWNKAMELLAVDTELDPDEVDPRFVIRLRLEEDAQREAIAAFAESLRLGELANAAIGLRDSVNAWSNFSDRPEDAAEVTARSAAVFAGYALVNAGLVGVLSLADTFKAVITFAAEDVLGRAADHVAAAAAEDIFLNDVAAHMLGAVGQVPEIVEKVVHFVVDPMLLATDVATLGTAGGLTGAVRDAFDRLGDDLLGGILLVSDGDLSLVRSTLLEERQPFAAGLTEVAVNEPVIHLGEDVLSFYFDGYAATYAPTGDNAWPASTGLGDGEGRYAAWLRRASPALQFAYVLELATEILIQSMNTYSAVLAISEPADAEGPIGATFRAMLSQQGYGCFADVFGGTSFSRFAGMVYKQMMVDRLLAERAAEGKDPTCLYEVFCWMATEEQRAVIDTVLGTPDSGGERSRDGVFWRMIDSLKSDPTGFCAFWDALPCEDREAVRSFVSYSGCLATLFTGVDARPAAPASGEEEPDAGPSLSRPRWGSDPDAWPHFSIDDVWLETLAGSNVVKDWAQGGPIVLGELGESPGHGRT